MEANKNAKNADYFFCENCDFKCSGRANMTTHKLLCKPKNDDKMMTMMTVNTPTETGIRWQANKQYHI